MNVGYIFKAFIHICGTYVTYTRKLDLDSYPRASDSLGQDRFLRDWRLSDLPLWSYRGVLESTKTFT